MKKYTIEWDNEEKSWYCKRCDVLTTVYWKYQMCCGCHERLPNIFGMKHVFITFQGGPGEQKHIAHIYPKRWLIAEFSDYVYNLDEYPESLKDDTYYLVVDGKGINVTDLEIPTVSLARKADIIWWSNANENCIFLNKGCISLFEEHFGKIIDIKKYNRDEYSREYEKMFRKVYYEDKGGEK